MTQPIKPHEVAALQHVQIPGEVFEAFNELIAEKFTNAGFAVVRQKDVVVRILSKLHNQTASEIFKNGWLNVELAYQNAGWVVDYDKPGFNESYEAFFRFTVPKEKKS